MLCIDAVGLKAHGHADMYAYDRAKQALSLETDRPRGTAGGYSRLPERRLRVGDRRLRGVHRQVPHGGGHESVADRSGPVRRTSSGISSPCWRRIERGEIDPSFVITHRLRLEEAPRGYEIVSSTRRMAARRSCLSA